MWNSTEDQKRIYGETGGAEGTLFKFFSLVACTDFYCLHVKMCVDYNLNSGWNYKSYILM